MVNIWPAALFAQRTVTQDKHEDTRVGTELSVYSFPIQFIWQTWCQLQQFCSWALLKNTSESSRIICVNLFFPAQWETKKKNQKKKGRCQKIKLFLKPPNLLKFIIKKNKNKKKHKNCFRNAQRRMECISHCWTMYRLVNNKRLIKNKMINWWVHDWGRCIFSKQ